MKKKMTIILVMLLLFMVIATSCSSNTGNSKSLSSEETAGQESSVLESSVLKTSSESNSLEELDIVASFQMVDVAIAGAEMMSSYDTETLCIYLDVINTSNTIIQPCNEIKLSATQAGESLNLSNGETYESRMLYNDSLRNIFPGAIIRTTYFFELVDDTKEIILTIVDIDTELMQNFKIDLTNLPSIMSPVTNVVDSFDLTSIDGYVGNKAKFEDNLWTSGELTFLEHEFVQQGNDKYVVLYFDMIVTDNLDDDDTFSPYMNTSIICYQDGIEIGISPYIDDRDTFEGYNTIHELSLQTKDFALNESVRFATTYKLKSKSDLVITAAYGWCDFKEGDPFIGEVIPIS